MKKILMCFAVLTIGFSYAQELSEEEQIMYFENIRENFRVKERDGRLILGDSAELKKGDKVLINKPLMKDFQYVNRDARGLKILDKAADYAGVAGVASGLAGFYAKDIGTLRTSHEILSHSNNAKNVVWTADQIDHLNASKKAKKIIGQDFIITDWNIDSDAFGAYLIGEINNKRYKVDLVLALIMGEILLY